MDLHIQAECGVPVAPRIPLETSTDRVVVELGPCRTILSQGQLGLEYFPDETIVVLQRSPARLLFAAGVSSYLVEGPEMASLNSARKVLTPGPKGAFDNGYAGIAAADWDIAGEVRAFYHAEDHEDMPRFESGIPGFYASIALAVSHDRGLTFRKIGPVITGQLPKDLGARSDQGVGDLWVTRKEDNRYLYCYYSDHSRIDRRGVQICLARSAVQDRGMPGTWTKYFEGSFGQPGLGGKDTPVMSMNAEQGDAMFPHVTYSRVLGQYLMLFNVVAYRELNQPMPNKTGMYIAFSSDGIRWSTPAQILRAWSVPRPDDEIAWHPTLVWDDKTLTGWLYYSYSPHWGHGEGRASHYLVGRPFKLSR